MRGILAIKSSAFIIGARFLFGQSRPIQPSLLAKRSLIAYMDSAASGNLSAGACLIQQANWLSRAEPSGMCQLNSSLADITTRPPEGCHDGGAADRNFPAAVFRVTHRSGFSDKIYSDKPRFIVVWLAQGRDEIVPDSHLSGRAAIQQMVTTLERCDAARRPQAVHYLKLHSLVYDCDTSRPKVCQFNSCPIRAHRGPQSRASSRVMR